MSIVCPVTLTKKASGKYLLPKTQEDIMKQNLHGHYHWDPESKRRYRNKPTPKPPRATEVT